MIIRHIRAALLEQGGLSMKGDNITVAVFRIEKTRDYTVMSNHHLRNRSLSLKAKGLLTQMLSLPEDWDYTLAGLSHINRESVEAIRTAVLELEAAGYVTRIQTRSVSGRMGNIEYTIYEQPQESDAPPPSEIAKVSPSCDFPMTVNPTSEKPTSENATQLNKEVINKDINKDSYQYPILSSFPKEGRPAHAPDGMDGDVDRDNLCSLYEKQIRENIGLDELLESHSKDREAITGLYHLIVDTAVGTKKSVTISGNRYSAQYVRKRFMRLTAHHILYILDNMDETKTKARNIKAYLLAALFNAPLTIDSYYANRVRHERGCGER